MRVNEKVSTWAACPFRREPTRCKLARGDLSREKFALRDAGVGSDYLRAEMGKVHSAVREKVARYTATLPDRVAAGEGLLIMGRPGTGKTCILAILARAALRHSVGMELVHAHDFIEAAFRRHPNSPQRILDWRTTPLLLVDDFGAEVGGDAAAAAWDALFEFRNAHALATCVTTNLTVENLKETEQWERVYDRLRSRCHGLEIPGESQRLPLPGL